MHHFGGQGNWGYCGASCPPIKWDFAISADDTRNSNDKPEATDDLIESIFEGFPQYWKHR